MIYLITLNFLLNDVFKKSFFIFSPFWNSIIHHVNRSSRPIHSFSFLFILRHCWARSKLPFVNKWLLRLIKSIVSKLQRGIILFWKTVWRLYLVRRKSEIVVNLYIRSEGTILFFLFRFHGFFCFIILRLIEITSEELSEISSIFIVWIQ